jgi:pyruvate formate lyase activating enzyme
VPLHFTPFHPDWKMRDKPATQATTLSRARDIARANGVRHVYTGNVHDLAGGSTWCHCCGALLIGRYWFDLTRWPLDENGRCRDCETLLAGVFEPQPDTWGRRRQPVMLRH